MRMNRSTLKLAAMEYPVGSPELGYFDPVSAVAGGASILGGVLGARGEKKAAQAQAQSAAQSNEMQRQMFEQSRQDQMPWMQAGQGALNQYAAMLGLQKGADGGFAYNPQAAQQAQQTMQMDPGYQFRLGQGTKAIENSAAARGGLLSGNTARALSDYGQQTASDEYANILNRYASLAGVGQTQANQLGAMRQNLAGNLGQGLQNIGAARASGYQGRANAYGGMLGGLTSAFGMGM